MALQFRPYPIVNPEQYQDNKPDWTRDVSNPIMQGLQMLIDKKRQDAIQKRQDENDSRQGRMTDISTAMEMAKFGSEYGDDALMGIVGPQQQTPNTRLFSPNQTANVARTGMPSQPMTPGQNTGPDFSNMPMVQQFMKTVGNKPKRMFKEPESFQDYANMPGRERKMFSEYSKYGNRNTPKPLDPLQREKTQLEIEKLRKDISGKTTDVEKKAGAKQRVSGNLSELASLYGDLSSKGGIVDTDNRWYQNVGARIASTDTGQAVGRTFGTEKQSLRNRINQMRPLLLQEIRQASEMGARGLDSEKELEFYLQAATDPGRDIQANMAAIGVLDKAYGLGMGIKEATRKMTATNPKTGDKIISLDGGKTWEPF